MIFSVKFGATNGYAVEKKRGQVGVNFLDEARKKTGVYNLNAKLVEAAYCSVRCDLDIEISEDIARESELFAESSYINVSAKRGFFNEFVVLDMEIEKCDNNGEIKKVVPTLKIDKEKVINYWVGTGYSVDLKQD